MVILMSVPAWVFAQNATIGGRVTDAKDNSPLPGVVVQVEGASASAVTDGTGSYKITVANASGNLVFSLMGYQTQKVSYSGKLEVNVSLAQDVSELDEVVIVGYSEKKKSSVTAAISSVAPKEIQNLGYAAPQQAIQGRVAGVNMTQQSGSPGSGVKVRIRGTGSNGNSEPLYIVDGMRTGDISFLDPNEIESMEVLKDAASAAIYGANGANGVIIITTKKGGNGKAQEGVITYDFQYGVQMPNNRLKMMNSAQHAEYMAEAGSPRDSATLAGGLPTTDWMDEIMNNAPQSRHTLSFSGSSAKTSYFLQGSFYNQDGVIGGENSKYKRYSVRLNLDNQVKSWLNVGLNMGYIHANRTGIAENSEFGGVVTNAILMDPVTPVTYTGAIPGFVQNAIDAGKHVLTDANGNYYGLSEYVNGEIFNPVAGTTLNKGSGQTNDRVFGTAYGRVKFDDHWSATTRIGIDADFGSYNVWNPSYYFTPTRENPLAVVTANKSAVSNWLWENFVNYAQTFGKHQVTGLLGTSAFYEGYDIVSAVGSGLTYEGDNFGYLDGVLPGNANTVASGFRTTKALASYFGRVGYSFDGKYLLEATVRADGSSMLADGHRWGYFPSASAGWILTNEDWFKVKGLSFLKARASWGQNGSLANLSPGQWQSAISFNFAYPDAADNLLVAAEPNILNNPELSWETSTQTDIGLDFGFWDNRIKFTFDYFYKKTSGLIARAVVPDFVGNNAPVANIGDVVNKGYEMELTYNEQFGDFGITASANATFLKNEVTALEGFQEGDEIPGIGVGTGWTATAVQVGQPLWYFRGYQTDGVFQTQQQIDDYIANYTGYTPNLGDPVVVDANGDGQISTDDQTKIGSPHPSALLGIRLAADYKGFDFTLFAQGTFGNDILMGFNRVDRGTANKPEFFYTDRWTPSNTSATWFSANTSSSYAYNSDFMIFDGSFMRIKQIQLGYTIPTAWANSIKLSSCRLYVSAENMFTFTKYPGIDPEIGSYNDNGIGIDRGTYSVPKRLLMGVTVKF